MVAGANLGLGQGLDHRKIVTAEFALFRPAPDRQLILQLRLGVSASWLSHWQGLIARCNLCKQAADGLLFGFDVQKPFWKVPPSMMSSCSNLYPTIFAISDNSLTLDSRVPSLCDQFLLGANGVDRCLRYAFHALITFALPWF